MRRLEEADQPLYGRRTGRLVFPPFHVEHVRAFVPGYDVRDAQGSVQGVRVVERSATTPGTRVHGVRVFERPARSTTLTP